MEDYQKLAAQLEEQIKKWQEQVEKLQSLIPGIDDGVKEQCQQQFKSLNATMENAASMLSDLQSSQQAAWKEVEKGAGKAFEEWQKGWEKAMKQYQK